MNVDLEQSLDRLARSVGDDVAAERLGGQVHHMVARIRRRRAARRTATSVVGVGAAAAVAFGGVQLFERLGTGPQTVGPAEWDAAAWGCGPAPEISQATGERTLNVSHDAAAAGDGVLRVGVTVGASDPTGLVFDADPTVVLARDGVVVSRPGAVTTVAESFPPQYTLELDLGSCAFDGAPLPDGSYEVRVAQTVGTPDGPVELFSSTPLLLGEGEPTPDPTETTDPDEPTSSPDEPTSPENPPATLTPEQEAAAEQIEAWIASPVENPNGVMPRCGAEAVLDDGSTPLVLDRPLTDGMVQSDDGYFETTATMRTRGDQYVIGNAGSSATLVLMREGVVVGYQWLDTEELLDVDLRPDETLEVPLRGNRMLCGTGEGGSGPALPLPPGTYKATAVVDVMLKEVGVVGGEAEAVTRTVPVMSEVFDLTIT